LHCPFATAKRLTLVSELAYVTTHRLAVVTSLCGRLSSTEELSVNVFKRKLKTHLFNIAYPT